jgi:cytochrome o ubiquinol oxidase operon protein cyoD
MSDRIEDTNRDPGDVAPGDETLDEQAFAGGPTGYLLGLGLASLLTVASFLVVNTHLVWGPAVPMALVVFALAQMGVHLIFFLHVTSGPDNTNNILALAFGILIVMLVIFGSVWIMHHLNHNLMPMQDIMNHMR